MNAEENHFLNKPIERVLVMKKGMVYDVLLDTLDKSEDGPILDEKTWDSDFIEKISVKL